MSWLRATSGAQGSESVWDVAQRRAKSNRVDRDPTLAGGIAYRTTALAVLRGELLDPLATSDPERVSSAVGMHVQALRVAPD